MKYNPDVHHRHSVRLRDYDYSEAGAYFVTICTQNKECLFGEIVEGQMQLNDAGKMIDQWWVKIPVKFNTAEIDEYVIMPNHVHGIIVIVGADPCVCPDLRASPEKDKGAHTGAPLHEIIQWVKTMATNEYIHGVRLYKWPPFPGKLWQRNYYEHIIRNENEMERIRGYIETNPVRWQDDEDNPLKSCPSTPY